MSTKYYNIARFIVGHGFAARITSDGVEATCMETDAAGRCYNVTVLVKTVREARDWLGY